MKKGKVATHDVHLVTPSSQFVAVSSAPTLHFMTTAAVDVYFLHCLFSYCYLIFSYFSSKSVNILLKVTTA